MGETTAVAHGGNPHMKALPPQDRAASLTTALERIILNGFKGLWINTISVMAGDSLLSNCVKLTEF
ncbi:hypothetical protein [Moorena sp. SIO3F7]|uniref:hypothetical protein n=1 Tax=Moorena sp. SIO3F7 TaxID=2607839 RepID=UPI0013FFF044|nr:hypothetical protein [Moorena sp. SIO3F7]NEO14439.1 hypothetical protein [Moorena sp. SIO3E8]NEP98441.1 hypothetical protein [Moorena sp. SIO3F7]